MSENQPEVVVWPIDKLQPYKNNARKISDLAVEKVARSIRNYGFRNPILANDQGIIIAGHTRLKAAQMIGLAEVPVIVCDLEEAAEMGLRLADNRTAQETEWDYDLLRAELVLLDGDFNFDLLDTGFDPSELASITEEMADVDFPELSSDEDAPEMQTLSFALHSTQVEAVKDALALFQGQEYAGNENKNGNALYFMAIAAVNNES